MSADETTNEAPSAGPAKETADDALEPERVAELAESGEGQIVDVRTDAEHEAGHIAGARHLPLDRLDAEAETLDRSKPVVFYCRGGGRSAMAAEAFRASGWEANHMDGGLLAWAERDLPLEPEEGGVAERSSLPGD
jgi:rhodanese-related sulfurtransferase